MKIDDYLEKVEEPTKSGLRKLYAHYEERIHIAKGSKTKHQAWVGGYIDHIVETCEIAEELYALWSARRPLPFTLSDALYIIFIHDLEKPFKYSQQPLTIEDPHVFILGLLSEFQLELTPAQDNAFTYIHGEGSAFSTEKRISNELCCFVHVCDTVSARLFYDYPKKKSNEFIA